MCYNLPQEVKPALPDLTQRTQIQDSMYDGNLKMNKSQKGFGWADSLLEIINILSYFLQTMTNWIFVFNNMVDLDTANVQISVNSSHHGRNDATIVSVLSRINGSEHPDRSCHTGWVLFQYFLHDWVCGACDQPWGSSLRILLAESTISLIRFYLQQQESEMLIKFKHKWKHLHGWSRRTFNHM